MELLGTGKQRAAKASQVLVGAQALTFASWRAGMRADDLDTVNFQSYSATAGESYDEGLHGVLGADLSFGGDWDAGTDPLGTPPGLYIRDDLVNLQLMPNRTDAVGWTFPYARIRGVENSAEVRGKVLFNVGDCKSQGVFTYPTGSV